MIRVTSNWLEHEGGTKFYQVFQLVPETGRSVTVTHWGKMAVARGEKNVRPVNGGETQVVEGRLLISKTTAKIKRGYSVDNSTENSYGDDSPWFVEHFGAELAHRIEVAMFADIAVEEPTPIPPRETTSIGKVIEPEAPRPESWGSW